MVFWLNCFFLVSYMGIWLGLLIGFVGFVVLFCVFFWGVVSFLGFCGACVGKNLQ